MGRSISGTSNSAASGTPSAAAILAGCSTDGLRSHGEVAANNFAGAGWARFPIGIALLLILRTV